MDPIKMDLDTFLAQKGVLFSVSDYLLDKTRIPHGETRRQQQKREKEADEVSYKYHERRKAAITEYNDLLSKGIIVDKSPLEKLIERANGHPDNASTQAARRMLVKRGFELEKVLHGL